MTNRYPIFTRASVVAAVGAVVAVLAHYGVVIPTGESGALVDLITVGGPLVVAVWAARHTTPVADPKTSQLIPLVPAPAPAPVAATAPAQVLVPASTAGVPALSKEVTTSMPIVTATAPALTAIASAPLAAPPAPVTAPVTAPASALTAKPSAWEAFNAAIASTSE